MMRTRWQYAVLGGKLVTAAVGCAVSLPGVAHAVLIGGYNVIDTFNFIDARTTNTAGIASGTRISFGLDVTPVGTQPPTATDGTAVVATQSTGPSFGVPYLFSPALPNQFFRSIDFSAFPTLIGSWGLHLTNPTVNSGITALVNTAPLATTTPPPFVTSALLTPSPANPTQPTISWDRGAYTPSSQSIYVYDKTNLTPTGGPTLIYTANIAAGANAFTIPAGVLTSDNLYTFAVQLDNRAGGALVGRSRTFVDFSTSVTVPVFLPVTGIDTDPTDILGAPFIYSFPVIAGEPISIDPMVAIGYEYKIGIGDPLFASVTLPDIGDLDGYHLCLWNGSSYDACSTHLDPNQTFTFSDGASQFRVTGINPGLELDPTDTTAFVTTLTFLTSGLFSGTQTPLVTEAANAVPEPASMVALITGMLGIGIARSKLRRENRNCRGSRLPAS